MRRILVAVVLCTILLSACATSTPSPPRDQWLSDVNTVRSFNGRAAVLWESDLEAMAQDWADTLCATNAFHHRALGEVLNGPWGSWDRLNENIAVGYPTWEAVHAGWVASPGHFQNIIDPNAEAVGVGFNPCGGRNVWVENFGNYRG